MKFVVRIAIYLVLLMLAGITFSKFRAAYQSGPTRTFDVGDGDKAPPAAITAETNAMTGATNAVLTNAVAVAETNAVAEITTNAPAAVTESAPPTPAPAKKADKSSAMLYLGCFLVAVLGLGIMGAWDIGQMIGGRAGRSVMAEDYTEHKDPDYEAAEEEWSKGNHLDAVRMLREYLGRNPSEQHAAIRIAEIYEKDLGNYLAAALELEEVLQKKLPREKWGWTAIRLSNLYSGRLNQPAKALAVLDRIVKDYSDTSAAKKARERLGIPEPTPEAVEEAAAPAEEPTQAPAPEPPPDQAALPKGFRKRK